MCIRDRSSASKGTKVAEKACLARVAKTVGKPVGTLKVTEAVSYTHLRAHETVLDLVCRLLLEKKKNYK